MALNLGKAVVDYLTVHPEEKFSARQIHADTASGRRGVEQRKPDPAVGSTE